jgi:hypothetical protein
VADRLRKEPMTREPSSKKVIPNFVFLALGRFDASLQKFNPPVGKWRRLVLTSLCGDSIVDDGGQGVAAYGILSSRAVMHPVFMEAAELDVQSKVDMCGGQRLSGRERKMKKDFFTFEAGMLLKTNRGENNGRLIYSISLKIKWLHYIAAFASMYMIIKEIVVQPRS